MMMTTKKMKKQPTDRPLTCSSLAFIQQSQLSLKKKILTQARNLSFSLFFPFFILV